jgi:hypothetical protein
LQFTAAAAEPCDAPLRLQFAHALLVAPCRGARLVKLGGGDEAFGEQGGLAGEVGLRQPLRGFGLRQLGVDYRQLFGTAALFQVGQCGARPFDTRLRFDARGANTGAPASTVDPRTTWLRASTPPIGLDRRT